MCSSAWKASRRAWRSRSASGVRGADERRRAGCSQAETAASISVDRRVRGQVRLDEQHRRGLAVEAQVVQSSTAADREPVEELEGDGLHPGARHAGHRLARRLERREEREQRGSRRRRGAEAQDRLGDDAERALGPDEQLRQAIARRRP